jgi:hypothetical protein
MQMIKSPDRMPRVRKTRLEGKSRSKFRIVLIATLIVCAASYVLLLSEQSGKPDFVTHSGSVQTKSSLTRNLRLLLLDIERSLLGIEIERAPKVVREMGGITRAIRDYYEAFHAYPEGRNADVAKKLRGQNQGNRMFLGWRAHELSPAGELKDPWDTVYYLQVDAVGEIDLRSAGPDRLLWTEDDVNSESGR